MLKFFCAICGDDVDVVVTRPLGKNNAMVNICITCDTEPATERRTERGYVPAGGMLSNTEITRALRAKLGDLVYEEQIARDEECGRVPSRFKGDDVAGHIIENKRRWRSGAARSVTKGRRT